MGGAPARGRYDGLVGLARHPDRPGTGRPWRNQELRPLPDAVHLELVRRINLAAPEGADVRGLADQVIATAAPGRGLIDVPLPWPDTPRRFGTPPMDPAQLPEEELIRLAVGVLAHLLPGVPASTPEAPPAPWPLPWRRRFRLHGSPGTVAGVRESLLAQGLVETDWRPTHIVLARPVQVMMAEYWAASVRNGGILKWSTAWRRAEAAGRLPPSIDVADIAERLATRSTRQVHVVAAGSAEDAAALAAEVLRADPAEIQENGDAAVSDLLRRLNRLTALAHGPGRVRELARTLAATLDEPATPAHSATSLAPPPPVDGLGAGAGGVHRRADPPGWLRCARRTGRPDPHRPPAARHRRPRTHPGAGRDGLQAVLAPER